MVIVRPCVGLRRTVGLFHPGSQINGMFAPEFDIRRRPRLKLRNPPAPSNSVTVPEPPTGMAKSKSSKLSAGTPIRVNQGVTMPEFPQVDISGWTGAVSESQGRGADIKYIVEWDAETRG